MKTLKFGDLKPETREALLKDPLLAEQEGAVRLYVPTRRKPAPADDVVQFYCARVAIGDETPTATTAERYGVTARRVRQLTEGVRSGAEPFPVMLPDSEAFAMIKQAETASALRSQLESGSRQTDLFDDGDK